MKVRNIIIILVMISACVLLWVLGRQSEITPDYENSSDQLVFRMVEYRTAEHPTNIGVHLFADLVEERTDGAIKIIIYDEGVLGDESSIIEQLSYGGIDFARVSGVYLDEYAEDMSALCLPGIYDDNEAMMQVFNDETVGTEISEILKYEKINVLTWYPGSIRGIFCDTDRLRYMSEAKIAIPKSQMKIIEMEAMGYQPVPYIQGNENSYLEGGYVEGVEGDLLDYYYNKSYHKAKHFTMTESRIPEAIVVSNAAMMQLTVDQQQIIIQAAYEAGVATSQLISEMEESILVELNNSGCKFDDIYQDESYEQALEIMKNIIDEDELLAQISQILD